MIDSRGNHQPRPYTPPRRAGELRRYTAATVDLLLPVTLGLLASLAVGRDAGPDGTPEGDRASAAALGVLIGVSFLNHTLLTWISGASVGKLLTGIRAVRTVDGTRPGPFRLTWRWLAGLCWLPLQPYYWLRSWAHVFTGHSSRGTVRDNEDGELYEDICGVRHVRREDLTGTPRTPYVPRTPYAPSR